MIKYFIRGKISYYGVSAIREHLNVYTASGDKFDPEKMACALPKWVAIKLGVKFHDMIMFRNYEQCGECTGQCGLCKNAILAEYNDTGPNIKLKRIADATVALARKIGMLEIGIKKFEISKAYLS